MRTRLLRCLLIVTACLLAASVSAGAQAAPSDSLRLARLSAFGRLWGTIKYFHPAFLSKDVSWDSAVVAAIPRTSAARTSAEYRAAVVQMLAALGDRQTRVVSAATGKAVTESPASPPPAAEERTRWEADSTLIVAIPSFEDPSGVNQRLRTEANAVRAARQIVFDLRGPALDEVGYASTAFDRAGISALLLGPPMNELRFVRVKSPVPRCR